MPPRKKPVKTAQTSQGVTGNSLSVYWEPFLRYLESECGMSTNTIDAYGSDLKQFFDWYRTNGPQRIQQVGLPCLTNYIEHLHAKELAASSIARHLVSIKMFFRYLVLESVLLESAAEMLSSPKLWQYLPQVLSPEKVDELLNAPQAGDRFLYRDKALLALLYATGCRASELCDLQLKDINLQEYYCRCTGKGNKERLVSLNPLAVRRIEEYLEQERPGLCRAGNKEFLFLTQNGNRLSRMSVWNIVTKYARRVGCSNKVSPHTLRHSFATHLLAGGAEIRALQELLGHASIRTTQVYTHVEHSRLKAVHSKHHPRG